VQLVRLREVLPHRPHLLREGSHRLEDRVLFEVVEHRVAVMDSVDVAQRRVEEGLEVVFPATGGDRLDDLVEVQV
jgi:hypothetical protein